MDQTVKVLISRSNSFISRVLQRFNSARRLYKNAGHSACLNWLLDSESSLLPICCPSRDATESASVEGSGDPGGRALLLGVAGCQGEGAVGLWGRKLVEA